MPFKYSVVIPTYGDRLKTCLQPCLESIIRNSDPRETEIIVVANGCTDETRKHINGLIDAGLPVRLIWFNDPLGYTKATNVGIQQCNADLIVLMNNDTAILDWS